MATKAKVTPNRSRWEAAFRKESDRLRKAAKVDESDIGSIVSKKGQAITRKATAITNKKLGFTERQAINFEKAAKKKK